MFERDKTELRELGVPLETGRRSIFDTADGYRIARAGLRARRDRPGAGRGHRGRAGRPPVGLPGAGRPRARRAASSCVRPVSRWTRTQGRIQPRAGAAASRRSPRCWPPCRRARGHVRPPPRRPGRRGRAPRTVEPWGVVSLAGPLVPRRATTGAAAGAAVVPGVADRRAGARRPGRRARSPCRPGVDLVGDGPAQRGAAAGRSRARRGSGWPRAARTGCAGSAPCAARAAPRPAAGDEIELELRSVDVLARWVAGHGPDAVVLDPPELADARAGAAGRPRPRRDPVTATGVTS